MAINSKKMNVLVIEKDRAIGWFLQQSFANAGHDAKWVTDRDPVLENSLANPDLVILDLGLSCDDCVDLLTKMRRRFASAAILVLSDRSTIADRLQFLDLGADDFVLKPFSMLELLARCRGLLRRIHPVHSSVERFGDLEMNQLTRAVSYKGTAISLTSREFQLLQRLMLKRGDCCSRVDLLNELWPSQAASGTNIVDVHISYIRRKLEDACHGDEYSGSVIKTERGQGYRLRDQQTIATDSQSAQDNAPVQVIQLQSRIDHASKAKLPPAMNGLIPSEVWTQHTQQLTSPLEAA